MSQITFPPPLRSGAIIGVTAPSSGITSDLEARLHVCIDRVRSHGYEVQLGKCLRSPNIVSASAKNRAQELTEMLADDTISAIVPPWGGELLINILPHLDFRKLSKLKPKWIVGFSDMTTLLMPYTMLTGIATLHGSNFMETAINCAPTHTHWLDVLVLNGGDLFRQTSAEKYQLQFTPYQEAPGITEWNYSEPVKWKLLGQEENTKPSVTVSGRLIGGCLETVSMLPGTAYGDIKKFAETYAPEGLLVYLEVCEEKTPAACRMFHHLKLAGWFKYAKGILIGRNLVPAIANFSHQECLIDVFGDLDVPIIYDMDIGHVPPQVMLVNGALATVRLGPDVNSIEQELR